MKVAVLQSNYLPWQGYFKIIQNVELLVFYDDVQFTKNDWRNRNRLLSPNGYSWLTIPVGQKIDRLINEVKLPIDASWKITHKNKLQGLYKNAKFVDFSLEFLDDIFSVEFQYLSEFNQFVIKKICNEILKFDTRFADSTNYNLVGSKSERLQNLLIELGASSYVCGPNSLNYIDVKWFELNKIELVIIDYEKIIHQYEQLAPSFNARVSILDMMCMLGKSIENAFMTEGV